jgi:hypothetical protein
MIFSLWDIQTLTAPFVWMIIGLVSTSAYSKNTSKLKAL